MHRKKAAAVLLVASLVLYVPMAGLAAPFSGALSQDAGPDIEAGGIRAGSYRTPRLSSSAPADTLRLACSLLVQGKEPEIIIIPDYAIPLSSGISEGAPEAVVIIGTPSEAEQELDIVELTPIPAIEAEDMEAEDNAPHLEAFVSNTVVPDEEPEATVFATPPEETPAEEIGAVDVEAPIEAADVAPVTAPVIVIDCYYDGEMMPGKAVTLSAQVSNTPEDATVSYQWQNDAGGTFEDVPGAADLTYVFYANDTNKECQWRLRLSFSYTD